MDRKLQQQLEQFRLLKESIEKDTGINPDETEKERRARKAKLEAPDNQEAWIAYYFPSKYPPAPFHKEATQRIVHNADHTESRNWSRENAKSTRTMMETLYLAFVGNIMPDGTRRKKRNVLMISNSEDNAKRLLAPYRAHLEANQRLLQDYGKQQTLGEWEEGEFTCKEGASFRAIGAGQSPRGTRNGDIRPDTILVDDIDTDEDCLNIDIIDKRWNWIVEALIPTRSISEPLLVIFCGNIIAEDCCVSRAHAISDYVHIVNIRDEEGRSTWPEKNTEELIDRALKNLPYSAIQKEYYNNPLKTEKTFPELTWAACPPISKLAYALIYSDPSPSNRDMPGKASGLNNSRKATFVLGFLNGKFYIYYGFLDAMGTDRFIEGMFDCRDYAKDAKQLYNYVENNTLQDPFFQQVLKERKAIVEKRRGYLPISPDERKKPDKWTRIEGTLEPINRAGNLIFNIAEQNNPHMKRLAQQFKSAKPTSKELDGPDCIEGGIFKIIEKNNVAAVGTIRSIRRTGNKKRF